MSNRLISQGLLGFVNPLEWVLTLSRSKASKKKIQKRQRQCLKRLREALRDAICEQLDMFQPGVTVSEKQVSVVMDVPGVDALRELISWSDEELIHLHDHMISKALEDLKHARGVDTRKEILQWMAPSAQADAPFSFESCCAIAGLDPNPIRSFVKKNYLAELKAYIAEDDAKLARHAVAYAHG